MKKLLTLSLVLLLLAGASFATSVDLTRGVVYTKDGAATTCLTLAATTILSDSTYLAPYINRAWFIDTTSIGGASGVITIECSADNSKWVSPEAIVMGTSGTHITTGAHSIFKVVDNPMPYWKVSFYNQSPYTGDDGTLEVTSYMCTE